MLGHISNEKHSILEIHTKKIKSIPGLMFDPYECWRGVNMQRIHKSYWNMKEFGKKKFEPFQIASNI